MGSRARIRQSTFKGLEGFPRLIQDQMAMLRALYVGSLVADRDHFRSSRPGMNANDFDRIEDADERLEYQRICKLLANVMRTEKTQTTNTREFFTAMGLDPVSLSVDDLPIIQEKMSRYRIIYINYHNASGICTLNWTGDNVLPRVIYLVSDGVKWDTLTGTTGVFGKFFCPACLKTANNSTAHRCRHTCMSCSALMVEGNCNGSLNLKCDECFFTFKTKQGGGTLQNRCQALKYCIGCNSVYRTSQVHVCGESIYCNLCEDYKSNQHDCSWVELSERQRSSLKKEQKEFRLAFFDIESTQNSETVDGQFVWLDQHYCTTIAMIKVCYLCEDRPVDEPCSACGTRKELFNYRSKTEDKYEVVDRFCDYVMKDPTMKNRTLYSHNGGRFDTHLVLRGFLRMKIRPKLVKKGSTIIRAEVKMRGRKVVFKDSFTVIPMALSEFSKAFELGSEEKGTFPHFANMRCNWGKEWDSIPPKKYFGDQYMKPGQKKAFDEWHASMEGKKWNQDDELKRYCMQDAIICMKGALKYRQTMLKATSWCPLTCANTLASFCQFLLRAEYLTHLKMPYLPEAGYGAVNQSKFALKYFKWLESQGRVLQHAHSPMGERKESIGNQVFSLDCYEAVGRGNVIELMGCYFHGCKACYPDGTLLVGGERAEELRARTMARIEKLKTRFDVEVIWECELKEKMKTEEGKAMKKFFEITEIVERLRLRDALYGGRVEVIRTYLKATLKTAIKYLDVCSMYPAVMSLREYPIGRPEVITSNFKPIIGVEMPYRGIAKLRVLPPRNLELAVLPLRHESALFFSLCYACVKERAEECTHENEMERSWVGTYATVEINLALENGYRVLEVHEVWHWVEWSDQVYRQYFKNFMKMKFAASGFPAGVLDPAQQEEYCKKVGEKLGFELRPNEVIKSTSLRTVCKFCNNSCWGKLAEVPTHAQAQYLSVKEFLKLKMDASQEITDVVFESDDTLLVNSKAKVETIRANRFSAVHHAVHVTAYARVLLYNIIKKVGTRAAYCDTDSVVFEMDRDEENPLADLLTGELGDLSDEVRDGWEIKEAVFAGCKNYTMRMENLETGEKEDKQAIRGFRKDHSALEILKHEKIKEMVTEKGKTDVPEFLEIKRPELKRKLAKVYSTDSTKRWRPVSFKRATRESGEAEIKVPFGYVDE